jgi:hypothetical protein
LSITVADAVTVKEGQEVSIEFTVTGDGASSAVIELSGSDASLFSVAGTTITGGPFNFVSPTDSDGNSVYELTVTATRNAQTVSENIVVTVEEAEPAQPMAFTVENTTAKEGEAVRVSFALTGTNAQEAAITLTGPDASLFTLGTDTVTAGAFDWERPDDANKNNEYELTLNAVRGSEAVSMDASVTVLSVPNEELVFVRGMEDVSKLSAVGPDFDGDGFLDIVFASASVTATGSSQETAALAVLSSAIDTENGADFSVSAEDPTQIFPLTADECFDDGEYANRQLASGLSQDGVSTGRDADKERDILFLFGCETGSPNATGFTSVLPEARPVDGKAISANTAGAGLSFFRAAEGDEAKGLHSVADFSGDGVSDVVLVGSESPGMRSSDRLFAFFSGAALTPRDPALAQSTAADPGKVVRVVMANSYNDYTSHRPPNGAGDIDGDGKEEFAFVRTRTDAEPGKGEVVIVDGAAIFDDADGEVDIRGLGIGEKYTIRLTGGTGEFQPIGTGDFDGDKQDDLILYSLARKDGFSSYTAAVRVITSAMLTADTDGVIEVTPDTGSPYTITKRVSGGDWTEVHGNAIPLGDIDEDGLTDIIYATKDSLALVLGSILQSSSPLGADDLVPFITVDDSWTFSTGFSSDLIAADFDGDGVTDLLARVGKADDEIAVIIPGPRLEAAMDSSGTISITIP